MKREFLEISEAEAEYGGSTGWWRKVVFNKTIDSYRRGDRVVFKRSDIDAYFASRRVPALRETAGAQARA